MKQALILFTRIPVPGKTKTRLMPYFSPKQCAKLHTCFLKDISEQCRKVKADCFVCYAPEDGDVKELKDILGKQKEYFPQAGESLGQRMYHSLEYVLGLGYDVCLLMGTDIPEVSSPDLEKAFQVLKEKDAVFGRTADGGYYLVGMKRPIPEAFGLKQYGHSHVFEDTLKELSDAGINVGFTTKHQDMDTPEDLRCYRQRMRQDKRLQHSHTGRYLAANVKISVIIPVYNAEDYVLTCLESVLGQEGILIQVICIDDGSSDRSVAIMEEIAQVDDRLSVYAELNGGAGAARNRGIDLAQGRFLAFIDPDDYYPSSSSLAQLYAAALQNGAKMCGGSFISFLPSGEVRLSYYGDETPYTIKEAGFRSLEQDQFDYGWIRFIYQRELFSEQGLRFPLYRWYEDPVFFVNALALAGEYYVIPEPVYCYREDYKEPSWSAAKIRDMLAGIAHNLAFAQRNDLDRLYTRLIYRIDYDYGKAILDAIDDEEVLARIADIQGSLEVDRVAYLKEKGYEVYILKPLYYRVCAERKTAVRRLAEKLEASGLYKTMQTHYERFRKRR